MKNITKVSWQNDKKGAILIMTMVFTVIFLIVAGGLIALINQQQRLNRIRKAKAQALHLAEAGVNYYRWHLAHDPDDYTDGTGTTCHEDTNPCVHNYLQGDVMGQFSLTITPPPTGSTVVTIKSTGWVTDYEDYKRRVVAKYGLPSWARYAVVANADMRFGEGTTVHGPLHSNGGIRFDGLAYNEITSAQESYDDPDHSGDDEFGVHTHVDETTHEILENYGDDPTPPAVVPNRLDVFAGGRDFPVPTVDFNAITVDLAMLEDAADDNDGIHIKKSNQEGWHIILSPDGTFDYIKVDSSSSCSGTPTGGDLVYKPGWTNDVPFPPNNIIFVSDNVWIEGSINGHRLTIIAAKDPLASGDASIWINKNLTYTNYDGSDAIGLIAQNNINVGLYSENDLRIDAALIAQNGRVGRYYYGEDWTSCDEISTYYQRDTITVYGAIATNQRYGFSWVCSPGSYYCSGYETRNLDFDSNLTYAPPPSFPSTDTYDFISWEEVLEGETY